MVWESPLDEAVQRVAKWIENHHGKLLSYLLCFTGDLTFFGFEWFKNYAIFENGNDMWVTVSREKIAIMLTEKWSAKKLETAINRAIDEKVAYYRKVDQLPYVAYHVKVQFYKRADTTKRYVYFITLKKGVAKNGKLENKKDD